MPQISHHIPCMQIVICGNGRDDKWRRGEARRLNSKYVMRATQEQQAPSDREALEETDTMPKWTLETARADQEIHPQFNQQQSPDHGKCLPFSSNSSSTLTEHLEV